MMIRSPLPSSWFSDSRAPLACLALAVIGMGAPGAARAEPARGPAPAPAPYFVKTASSLADIEKTLQGKGAHGVDLLKPGATPLEIVWKHEEDFAQPEAEVHDGKDHVFFVTDGQASFTLGGQLVEPRQLSPGEWKSSETKDAQVVEAKKGDLLFIPHGTVHGRSVKGQHFTMLQISFWPNGAPKAAQASAIPAPAEKSKDKMSAPPSGLRPAASTSSTAKPE